MGRTLVIAECGSSWDCDIQKAFRLIDAAKECGADVAKFQWTSNAKAMAERRLGPNAAGPTQMYKRYLEYPKEWLTRLKAHCDSVSIEFMCTVYLPQDLDFVSGLAHRGKISAFESGDHELISAARARFDSLIISVNPGKPLPPLYDVELLHCISKYPTTLEDLGLGRIDFKNVMNGLSDHTANVLTGAAAVAAGAKIVEAHIRLSDTPKDNPDYPHSHEAPCRCEYSDLHDCFKKYVENIREVERML